MGIRIKNEKYDFEIKTLKHMTHYTNLENILRFGILSHNEAYNKKLINADVSDCDVQIRRDRKTITGTGIGVHQCASLYFNNRNPMLYARKNLQNQIYTILINSEVLLHTKSFFTDGNAACNKTSFYNNLNALNNFDWETIYADSWNHQDEFIKSYNKRVICSEVLVYPKVETKDIITIVCPNIGLFNYAQNLLNKENIANHSDVSSIKLICNYETNKIYYF